MKAGLKDEVKFGLLGQVVMRNPQLAEFEISLGETKYAGLRKVIMDFSTCMWHIPKPAQKFVT